MSYATNARMLKIWKKEAIAYSEGFLNAPLPITMQVKGGCLKSLLKIQISLHSALQRLLDFEIFFLGFT